MNRVYFGDLPLFFKFNDSKVQSVAGAPEKFPIELHENPDTGLISMTDSAELEQLLKMAYIEGSEPSGYMAESGIGEEYARDFVEYIENAVNESLIGLNILEIGCGEGFLLNLLSEKGANCLGIDPNNKHRDNSSQDISIVKGFFPQDLPSNNKKFDLVIMFAVLEHFKDPVAILKQVRSHLNSQGKLIVSVPNCLPYLKVGDPSILFHEHFNYFTENSLKNILSLGGFSINVTKSKFGGNLYATGQISIANESVNTTENTKSLLTFYESLMDSLTYRFENFLNDLADEGLERIGIWVPCRAINLLALIHIPEKLRLEFYDHNESIIGKYLPGFDPVIRSSVHFQHDPPDIVIVMSFSFGQEIKKKLENIVKCKIILFEDFVKK